MSDWHESKRICGIDPCRGYVPFALALGSIPARENGWKRYFKVLSFRGARMHVVACFGGICFCSLMDKALVFGTKACRFESCQGHVVARRASRSCSWLVLASACRLHRRRNLKVSMLHAHMLCVCVTRFVCMHKIVCFARISCASLAQLVEHALGTRMGRGSIPHTGLEI